jgi:hypothetical protein
MKATILICAVLTTFLTSGAFAADEAKTAKPSKKASTPMTKEQRDKMASMHEKMAACLRSDKPMSECHSEMRKNCQEMMGKNGCPMMGEMGDMMGGDHMMHGGMMGGQNDSD